MIRSWWLGFALESLIYFHPVSTKKEDKTDSNAWTRSYNLSLQKRRKKLTEGPRSIKEWSESKERGTEYCLSTPILPSAVFFFLKYKNKSSKTVCDVAPSIFFFFWHMDLGQPNWAETFPPKLLLLLLSSALLIYAAQTIVFDNRPPQIVNFWMLLPKLRSIRWNE